MSHTDESLQLGVVGAQIELQIIEYNSETDVDEIVDISLATGLSITVQRPDLTSFTRTALLSSTGLDGKMYILTLAEDLTMDGTYYIQGSLVSGTWSGPSSVGQFVVEVNLG